MWRRSAHQLSRIGIWWGLSTEHHGPQSNPEQRSPRPAYHLALIALCSLCLAIDLSQFWCGASRCYQGYPCSCGSRVKSFHLRRCKILSSQRIDLCIQRIVCTDFLAQLLFAFAGASLRVYICVIGNNLSMESGQREPVHMLPPLFCRYLPILSTASGHPYIVPAKMSYNNYSQ